MSTTNVPSPTFGPIGYSAPLESAILAGTQEDFQAAFDDNLNFTTSAGAATNPTPQGQLATSLAAIIGNVNDTFLQYTNLVDPALTYGRMQDAIARIYFLYRIPSSSTVTQSTCTGLVGVVIPVGTQAQDSAGNTYIATQSGTIGANGTVVIPFANLLPGPIPCPASTLTTISQSITGWDAITNASAGVLGTNVETPAAFEQRRYASTAVNSTGWQAAVRGAVLSVPNVVDCYVTENDQTTNQTIGGFTLNPNSLYVAVVGGLASAVAYAIWTRKPPGCAYNGNTTVTVYDTQTGYTPPFPAYPVTFETPTNLPIIFAVQMANNGYVPSNALSLVQAAIIGAFSGLDGGQRVRIGQTVFAARYYSTLANLWSNSQVVSVLIGSPNATGAVFTGSISGTILTVTSVVSGPIVSGQILDDLTGIVLPGTVIVSQSSGVSGGAGVYVISPTQTVAPEAMYGIFPTFTESVVNISQYPAVSAGNISLTLV